MSRKIIKNPLWETAMYELKFVDKDGKIFKDSTYRRFNAVPPADSFKPEVWNKFCQEHEVSYYIFEP